MFFGLDVGFLFVVVLLFGFISAKNQIVHLLKSESTLAFIFIANVLLYLPFFFMERYTWPGTTALSILTLVILFSFHQFNNRLLLMLSLILISLINLNFLYKEYNYAESEKPITNEIWKTKRELYLKRTVWLCDKNDKRLGLVKGMIYYNNGQYLGALFNEDKSTEEIKTELLKFKINQIITLSPLTKNQIESLSIKSKVFESSSISIYQI